MVQIKHDRPVYQDTYCTIVGVKSSNLMGIIDNVACEQFCVQNYKVCKCQCRKLIMYMSVTYWFICKYLQMFKVRTATDYKIITQLHNPRHTVKTHNRHVPCLHTSDASERFSAKNINVQCLICSSKRLQMSTNVHLPNCMASRFKINEISSVNSVFNNK